MKLLLAMLLSFSAQTTTPGAMAADTQTFQGCTCTCPVATPTPVPTAPPVALGKVYEVGQGKAYADLGSVPFEALKAGETVLVYCGVYKEKLFLSEQGTAAAPITIKGVRCADGSRPVIDGDGATTRSVYKYRYSGMDTRGLITISQKNGDAWGYKPKHIVIEGLALRNADILKKFKNVAGTELPYAKNAAAIYIERGDDITIRDNEISWNGNGVFAGSGGTEEVLTRNLSLVGNVIHSNGNVGSDREHNVYIEVAGATITGNDFRPLRSGALGGNLKDRSAGLVFTGNRVDGGARTLDLVDAQNGWPMLVPMPSYRTTVVAGNLLIAGSPGPTNIVHYGGDSGMPERNRKGVLTFKNNTIIIKANQSGTGSRWRTQILDVTTNDESVQASNNVIHVSPTTAGAVPTSASWSSGAGVITLNNNVSNLNLPSFREGITPTGTVSGSATVAPGMTFQDDYKVIGQPGLGW